MLVKLLTVLLAAGLAPAVAAAEPAEPAPACREILDLGLLEERRARFDLALAALDQARQDPACRDGALVGLARTHNSMNDHKKALAAARQVLENSDDPGLRAEASFEIGRALYKPGRRLTKPKREAAEAYAAAVELSAGEHEKAVRGLMRIYRETRQEEKMAELAERFPQVRVRTAAEQRRAVAPKMPAAGPPRAPRVCATGEDAVFDPALPHFWDPGNAADEGYREPEKIAAEMPEIAEDLAATAEGVVRFAVQVDAEGEVVAVGILAGLKPKLDLAVMEAICGWVFRPAVDPDGEPAESYVMDEIAFPLADKGLID